MVELEPAAARAVRKTADVMRQAIAEAEGDFRAVDLEAVAIAAHLAMTEAERAALAAISLEGEAQIAAVYRGVESLGARPETIVLPGLKLNG